MGEVTGELESYRDRMPQALLLATGRRVGVKRLRRRLDLPRLAAPASDR
jgi:hypothetical protein